MRSGYEIAFDEAGLWNFGSDFAMNVVIIGVDNSSYFILIIARKIY